MGAQFAYLDRCNKRLANLSSRHKHSMKGSTMRATRFKVCAGLAVLALNAAIDGAVFADDSIPASATTTTNKQLSFELYCGGCSRSMEHRSSHLTFVQAIEAANVASKRWRRTEIVSTDIPEWSKNRYSGAALVSYRLYIRGCKTWQLQGTHKSAVAAEKAFKTLRNADQTQYRIVAHYTRHSTKSRTD